MPVPDGPQFRKTEKYNYPARRDRGVYENDRNVDFLVGSDSFNVYTYGEEEEVSAVAEVSNKEALHEVEYPLQEHDRRWADQHAESSGQVPLFKMKELYPATAEVEGLFSTKNARVPAMKLLGIADIDARRRTGVGLSSPDDLSKYSNRIVDKLASRGQVERPEEWYKNDLEFLSGPQPMHDWAGVRYENTEPVSEDDQRMGSARLRSAVRRPKKKTPPNTEQLRMDI